MIIEFTFSALREKAQTSNLVEFGRIPEFIGHFATITALPELMRVVISRHCLEQNDAPERVRGTGGPPRLDPELRQESLAGRPPRPSPVLHSVTAAKASARQTNVRS